jgi:hypothetical protein
LIATINIRRINEKVILGEVGGVDGVDRVDRVN